MSGNRRLTRLVNKAIASNLREVRERHGLTQEMFARKLREHPDLTRTTPRKILLREIRRAEKGNGIAAHLLLYIGLRFGPKYKRGGGGDPAEARAWIGKIYDEADRMGAK